MRDAHGPPLPAPEAVDEIAVSIGAGGRRSPS